MKKHIIGPLKKAEPFFDPKYLVLGAFCHKGKLNFLKSVSKEDSIDIDHDHRYSMNFRPRPKI
jgi:hypothetical protein